MCDPSRFVVECAPPGADYAVVNGIRMTGGSLSTRSSYRADAPAGRDRPRHDDPRAAAARLKVQAETLSTEDGRVLPCGVRPDASAMANWRPTALELKPKESSTAARPSQLPLHPPAGPAPGRARQVHRQSDLRIDQRVDGMLHAAVQHAPHARAPSRGRSPTRLRSSDARRAMASIACPARSR